MSFDPRDVVTPPIIAPPFAAPAADPPDPGDVLSSQRSTSAASPARTTSSLRALTYNILVGGGPRLQAIEQVIRDSRADVVGLQEIVRPDLFIKLAERLEMHHTLARSRSGWHVAVLSRWPFVEERPHGGAQMARALLETLVETPTGARLRIFVTHLRAEFSSARAGETHRLREINYVLERMSVARAAREPHLLMGDFNSLAPGERLEATTVLRHALVADAHQRQHGQPPFGHPSVSYILPPAARPFRPMLVAATRFGPLAALCNALAGAYMPRDVVRRMRAAGYADCYATSHPDPRTRLFTCPLPTPAGRIDYVFASPALAARLIACEVLTDTPTRPVSHASDHRPVLAEFALHG